MEYQIISIEFPRSQATFKIYINSNFPNTLEYHGFTPLEYLPKTPLVDQSYYTQIIEIQQFGPEEENFIPILTEENEFLIEFFNPAYPTTIFLFALSSKFEILLEPSEFVLLKIEIADLFKNSIEHFHRYAMMNRESHFEMIIKYERLRNSKTTNLARIHQIIQFMTILNNKIHETREKIGHSKDLIKLFSQEINSLNTKVQSSYHKNLLCEICQNGFKNIAMVPCGHLPFCKNCAWVLSESQQELEFRECQICREQVQETIEIFY